MWILKKYKELSQLRKNVLSGFITSGLNAVLLFIAFPLYLNYLGPERYGIWVTLSIILTTASLGEFGVKDAIIKYISEEFWKDNIKSVTEYISSAIAIFTITSFVVIVILLIINAPVINFFNLNDYHINKIKFFLPMIGLLSGITFFLNIFRGTLYGIGHVDWNNYIFVAIKFMQILIALGLFKIGFMVWALFWSIFITTLLEFIIIIIIISKKCRINLFRYNAIKKNKVQKLLKFGSNTFGASVFSILLNSFIKIIISKFIGFAGVSYYEISFKVTFQIRSLFQSGLNAIMPKASEIQGKIKSFKKNIMNLYKKSMQFIIFYALPLFLILFIFGKPILQFWLKSNFNIEIFLFFRILLVALFINLLSVPIYYIFMGVNKVRYCFFEMVVRACFTIIFIIIVLLFIKDVELISIVYISATGYVITTIYLYFLFFRYNKYSILR